MQRMVSKIKVFTSHAGPVSLSSCFLVPGLVLSPGDKVVPFLALCRGLTTDQVLSHQHLRGGPGLSKEGQGLWSVDPILAILCSSYISGWVAASLALLALSFKISPHTYHAGIILSWSAELGFVICGTHLIDLVVVGV